MPQNYGMGGGYRQPQPMPYPQPRMPYPQPMPQPGYGGGYGGGFGGRGPGGGYGNMYAQQPQMYGGDIRHNLRCLVEDMVVVTANSLNMEVDLAAVCKVVTVAVWAECTINHKDSRNIKMQARLAVK